MESINALESSHLQYMGQKERKQEKRKKKKPPSAISRSLWIQGLNRFDLKKEKKSTVSKHVGNQQVPTFITLKWSEISEKIKAFKSCTR